MSDIQIVFNSIYTNFYKPKVTIWSHLCVLIYLLITVPVKQRGWAAQCIVPKYPYLRVVIPICNAFSSISESSLIFISLNLANARMWVWNAPDVNLPFSLKKSHFFSEGAWHLHPQPLCLQCNIPVFTNICAQATRYFIAD